jgi:hypothetical protein
LDFFFEQIPDDPANVRCLLDPEVTQGHKELVGNRREWGTGNLWKHLKGHHPSVWASANSAVQNPKYDVKSIGADLLREYKLKVDPRKQLTIDRMFKRARKMPSKVLNEAYFLLLWIKRGFSFDSFSDPFFGVLEHVRSTLSTQQICFTADSGHLDHSIFSSLFRALRPSATQFCRVSTTMLCPSEKSYFKKPTLWHWRWTDGTVRELRARCRL